MRILTTCILACLLGGLTPINTSAADGKKLKLKIGTLAPTGTSYHKQLMVLKERWQKAWPGFGQFTVYPDGRLGTETEMVSAMSTGNLDAGFLTAAGLSQIEPAVVALQSMPLTFRSLDEVDQVTERMRPMLEGRLAAKGFVVLFWTDSGWVRMFSKQAVVRPDDLRKLKVFSWAGGKGEYEAWKSGGFNPVSLEPTEIFSGLGTGMITAAPMPPFFAMATQVDTVAPHMLEINWAPLVGALVLRKEVWTEIPESSRTELLKIATDIGREVKSKGRSESAESVEAMKKRKLEVHAMTPQAAAEWDAAADKIRDKIRGPVVPAELYDAVHSHLKEIRSAAPKP